MAVERSIAYALAAILTGVSVAGAAELPSRSHKGKPADTLRHCDIAGSPGVLAANGVCVRISGYISAGVGARQLK